MTGNSYPIAAPLKVLHPIKLSNSGSQPPSQLAELGGITDRFLARARQLYRQVQDHPTRAWAEDQDAVSQGVSKARAAMRAWQKKHALPADGFATQDLLTRIAMDARAKER